MLEIDQRICWHSASVNALLLMCNEATFKRNILWLIITLNYHSGYID